MSDHEVFSQVEQQQFQYLLNCLALSQGLTCKQMAAKVAKDLRGYSPEFKKYCQTYKCPFDNQDYITF